MRRLAFAAASFVLFTTLGCRKQRSNETGGVSDTTATPSTASVPAPAPADTGVAAGDFSFDQRQSFAQSIRQQLTEIDRQIQDLSSQAKSRGGAVSDRALANIRAARRATDRSLSRVEAATAADWDQIKQGTSRALDNLNESIEAAQPK
jgi:hypothetical protein